MPEPTEGRLRWPSSRSRRGPRSSGYSAHMSRVSTAVEALRDAVHRHPWWTDSLLALFLTFISVGSVIFGGGPHEPRAIHPLDAILVPVTTLPIALRRYRPLAVLAITVGAETLLLLFSTRVQVPFGVIVALYTVAARCERPVSVRAAEWVALPVTVGLIVNTGPYPSRIIPKLALFAIAWVIGDNIRTRRAYLAELEARAARLEREREERDERAVADERTRIARELHDVIAHNVSVMVVQATAGEEVFDADPGRARESLSAVASTGRAALAELRRLLGVIRTEDGDAGAPSYTPQPGIEYLGELVGQVREAGLAVELSVLGSPRELPEAVGLCAYRIVQEALTNTLKHADATTACVNVRYVADALELQVLDDGHGASAVNGEADGHGLIGMRERVALFGGELTAGPRAGRGYAVRARLPLAELTQ
jgi:signal transduction histidine kinase